MKENTTSQKPKDFSPSPCDQLNISAKTRNALQNLLEKYIESLSMPNTDLANATHPDNINTLIVELTKAFQDNLLSEADKSHIKQLMSKSDANYACAVNKDYFSNQSLLRELAHDYQQIKHQNPLPTETDSAYFNDAENRIQKMHEKHSRNLNQFWINYLSGPISTLKLPVDLKMSANSMPSTAHYSFTIPSTLYQTIQETIAAHEFTPFCFLFGVFAILLYRYSEQHEIIIGTLTNTRNQDARGSRQGNFVNTLPVRLTISENHSIKQFIESVKNQILIVLENCEYPFAKIIEALENSAQSTHFLQTLFAWQQTDNFSDVFSEANLVNALDSIEQRELIANLQLSAIDHQTHFELIFSYNEKLFYPSTIETMSNNFILILQHAIKNIDAIIATMPLYDISLQQKILRPQCTNVHADAFDYFIQTFENHCINHPYKIAITFNHQQITYRDLNKRINQLTHCLLANNVQPGSVVSIFMERSPEIIVAMLAIMKAGGTFLAIDSGTPIQRAQFYMSETLSNFMLTKRHFKQLSFEDFAKVVYLDNASELQNYSDNNPTIYFDPEQISYVIFTSGTGLPRGIPIGLASLMHCFRHVKTILNIDFHSKILGLNSVSSDVSLIELLLPLYVGASVHMVSNEQMNYPSIVAEIIHHHSITHLQATPTQWELLVDSLLHTKIKRVALASGESLSNQLASRIIDKGFELYNGYGSAETAIYTSLYKVESLHEDPIPIGKPFGTINYCIVDKLNQAVPPGIPGELLIEGIQVAKGYVKPEQSKNKFAWHTLSKNSYSRLYHTGDIVRYQPNGKVIFIGRNDSQIKLRGHRVDLKEIENVLERYSPIKKAIARKINEDIHQCIVAYLLMDPKEELDSYAIAEFIRKLLPDFMLPSFYIKITQLPQTLNGKIDISALPSAYTADKYTVNHPPENLLQQELLKLWIEILRIPITNIHTNFFHAGGHSLLAIKLYDLISRRLNIDIQITDLSTYPTIASLASHIDASQRQSDRINNTIDINRIKKRAALQKSNFRKHSRVD